MPEVITPTLLSSTLDEEVRSRFPDRSGRGEIAFAELIAHVREVTGVTLARTTLVDLLSGRRGPSESLLFVVALSLGLPFASLRALVEADRKTAGNHTQTA